MLQKYIVAEVSHRKKDYRFHETIMGYDKNISSLLLSDKYIKKDMEDNECYMYSLFESIINAGIYSSISSILRAIRNGVIEANLIIIYTTNLNSIHKTDGWYTMKDSNSLKKMLNCMTSVKYSYSFKTKVIERFEIYGDPILGDEINRPISALVNDLEKHDISALDSDRVVNTYGLSRELGEYYVNGNSILMNAHILPWEIHINPSLFENINPYFQLYDGFRVTSILSSSALKCARISLLSPDYVHCSDCSKEEWILTDEEKEILSKALTNEIWEKIKDNYCKSLLFADETVINKIRDLPIPDYSNLL